ncbi:MAG: hypothetical protein K9H65_06890 [Bacteroidales bacterium]|nr:hypothetical protein [Bacteroidales bacterium]
MKVNILKKIKLRLGNWLLKRKQKSVKRKKAVFNFDTAQTVGVLFSLDQNQSYQVIKEFLDFLDNKKLQTFALAYCPDKKIPDRYIGASRINIFTSKDLNWLYIPKDPMIEQFTAKHFDILFDLTPPDQFPTQYINNLSQACFKVGRESHSGKEHDMIFRIDDQKDIKYIIDQIKYYISRINKEE